MKQNDEARRGATPGDVRADAFRASFAGPALYAATLTAALFEETMRWFDQWCALSTRFCYTPPSDVTDPPFPQAAKTGNYSQPAEVGEFDDVEDLPRITKEDMLAHPRSMEFNIALHEMQERLFAGQPMGGNPADLPPGYERELCSPP